MGPVIAAVDFSDSSPVVLEAARREAAWREAPLLVMHVVQDLPLGDAFLVLSMDPEELRGRLRAQARRSLKNLLGGGPGRAMVLEGEPAATIVEAARTEGAQLLVLGNHSRHLAHELVVGSVSLKVSLGAPCPLLLVRAVRQT